MLINYKEIMKYPKYKNQHGFTLIEILVVVSIISISVFMATDFIAMGFKTARFTEEQDTAVQVARRSMEMIVKEIRGANTSEQGDYPLILTDDEEVIFFSDLDNDNEFEKIRYYVDNTELKKSVTEPGALYDYSGVPITTISAGYLNNDSEAVFIFYDETYTATDIINEVRLVKINLKINVTPSIAPNDVYVSSDVNLRNLKDNL